MASKQAVRQFALDCRALQPNKEELSVSIAAALVSLPEFVRAATVALYLDVRSEVRTRQMLPELLQSSRRIAAAWCQAGELQLFHLRSEDELQTGSYGILEPRAPLRNDAARTIAPRELDLVVVPGVAFDARGGRLGHGHGYYDKLLAQVRPEATLVGLAFDCQLVERVPLDEHDVSMDFVITQSAVYSGAGRSRR